MFLRLRFETIIYLYVYTRVYDVDTYREKNNQYYYYNYYLIVITVVRIIVFYVSLKTFVNDKTSTISYCTYTVIIIIMIIVVVTFKQRDAGVLPDWIQRANRFCQRSKAIWWFHQIISNLKKFKATENFPILKINRHSALGSSTRN